MPGDPTPPGDISSDDLPGMDRDDPALKDANASDADRSQRASSGDQSQPNESPTEGGPHSDATRYDGPTYSAAERDASAAERDAVRISAERHTNVGMENIVAAAQLPLEPGARTDGEIEDEAQRQADYASDRPRRAEWERIWRDKHQESIVPNPTPLPASWWRRSTVGGVVAVGMVIAVGTIGAALMVGNSGGVPEAPVSDAAAQAIAGSEIATCAVDAVCDESVVEEFDPVGCTESEGCDEFVVEELAVGGCSETGGCDATDPDGVQTKTSVPNSYPETTVTDVTTTLEGGTYVITVTVDGDARAIAESSDTKWYTPRATVTTTDGGFIVDAKWGRARDARVRLFDSDFEFLPDASGTAAWLDKNIVVITVDGVGVTGDIVSGTIEITSRLLNADGSDGATLEGTYSWTE